MLINLLFATVLIIGSWMVATVYYLVTSKQQEGLEEEIEALHTLLKQTGQKRD